MSETQRPKPVATRFEIPDLELEPSVRPFRAGVGSPAALVQGRGYGAPSLFDDDPLEPSGLSIELEQGSGDGKVNLGSMIDFDAHPGFDLEPSARLAASDGEPHSGEWRRADADEISAWPSGRVPDAEAWLIDPVEIALIGDYGSAPSNALLTPQYAYRVFARQRELKEQLALLNAERARAEAERETALAELGREVRGEAELVAVFQRFVAALVEREQALSQHRQALSSLQAELGAQGAELDTELTHIRERASAEQALAAEAARVQAERELRLQRAEAMLKRVQIEIRALRHVAEQKLGPQGGQVPDPEATQLAALQQRAGELQPEVTEAKALLSRAKQTLGGARAELDALRQNERQTLHKKQALSEHFRKPLRARNVALSASEFEQQKALAELGRAVLAARGTVPVTAPWLARVRSSSSRADELILRCETQRRALTAYDRPRVRQGVRLACTALALLVLSIILKLAL